MKNLQLALGINATFSMCTGMILIAFSQTISQLFEVEGTALFWMMGTGLMLFSFGVFYVSRQYPIHLIHVFFIILLDIGWVIASILVIGLDLFDINTFGEFTISIVALIVLSFAYHQSYALSKVDTSGKHSFRKTLSFSRRVNSDRNRAWEIISDLENYHNIAPNIDDTHIVSGKGQGMVRTCSSGGHSWSETCTDWKPGKQYTFLVNTSAPDYPYPLKFLRGTWGVKPLSDNTVELEMTFEFEYKHVIQSVITHPFMRTWFRKVCEDLLDNWKQKIEQPLAVRPENLRYH